VLCDSEVTVLLINGLMYTKCVFLFALQDCRSNFSNQNLFSLNACTVKA
jgi:hypothetical protein